ncbi:hypothetical protein GCM10022223_01760 [Kineosporia mesophila]|uniref:SRPBCC family protein n=1 Tax=Kineosporia mesophila TaxID=566012 RepID=A0ABP6YTR0_9ACTN|nr:hypothetical protein [Kineosporia mesophila]MCD5352302.1 hypothetical protein [Kineosporia mesophila]
MARFRVEVSIAAPVPVVWARLTDWSAHGRMVPLTSIRVIGAPDQVGSVFVARTGIGPLAFDDSMRIDEFEPPAAQVSGEEVIGEPPVGPARFRVTKTGRVVKGWAEAELWPTAAAGGLARPSGGPAGSGATAGNPGGSAGSGESGGPIGAAGSSPGTRLVWTEEIRVVPEFVTRFAGPLVGAVAKAGYGTALRKLGRDIEGEVGIRG